MKKFHVNIKYGDFACVQVTCTIIQSNAFLRVFLSYYNSYIKREKLYDVYIGWSNYLIL